MLSYQIYKMAHFLGIFMILAALGGTAFAAMQSEAAKHPWRKVAAVFHGVGLFLVLLGGFGMLARLGLVAGLPGWIYGKLALWLLLGAMFFVARRRPALARSVWIGSGVLALGAGYLALYKPF